MQARKPVIYMILRRAARPGSPRFDGFATRLAASGAMPEADYRTLALNDLIYTVNTRGEAAIFTTDGQQVLHDADFVYFKSWERMPERAGAVAQYLKARGVEFEDEMVASAGTTKLSQLFRLWAAGCQVIPSIVARELPSAALVGDILGAGPYLLKPIRGEKGARTVVVETYEELLQAAHAFAGSWILQPYLRNDGDYRLFVYGYQVRGAMWREAEAGGIVNNTTQGARATYIEASELPEQLRIMARKAALAAGNAVAGVDILPHGDAYYVLEVNQGSQIVTGKFTAQKMQALGDYFRERLSTVYRRQQRPTRLRMIGRSVHARLPEFNNLIVHAKVDTGAYQSALHATNIREEEREGQKVLVFNLLDGHHAVKNPPTECVAHEYDMVKVVSSSGHQQERYRIKTFVSIAGIRMKTMITLTNRADMTLPMLLGRQFLRGRYVVNVELSRKRSEEMK